MRKTIKKHKQKIKYFFLLSFTLGFILIGAAALWVSTLEIPSLDGFETRQVTQSTKIYDRTGDILLFDVHNDIRRTIVPLENISKNLKNAAVAIEDPEFYVHNGIKPKAILRAVYVNIVNHGYSQGGSTITQQVVKNSLLTQKKLITRKVKEWILALKIEKILTKEEILEIYLNESPYGGTIYGAEEASKYFFGKPASKLTLVEAAYLAALPQAPTYYSPYGGHLEALEARKNLVLRKMFENGFTTEKDYRAALNETVKFKKYSNTNIEAPHFVFFIREYLEEKYGKDTVYNGGLKIITTLDYDMQKNAEEVVRKYAFTNEKKFNAENAALVAIDPKTGQILAMVGSRDYFDKKIDGKFNVATSPRQPGSTFKPFVYTKAFSEGYTPETVVFDLPTQFSVNCPANQLNMDDGCYSPVNYDGKFEGPITLRNALAQSRNIPAIKTLYLVGIQDALNFARSLGITSLTKSARHYGFSLVLGGGEVSPLEMVSAYSTIANDGVRNPYVSILKVEDSAGTILEEYKNKGRRAISSQAARLTSDVLSDNVARTPSYGANSCFHFNGNYKVATKTGTTNDFRDVWIMGYTPDIAVGTWAGNNDNSPIIKKVAGFVIAPMWCEFMRKTLPTLKNSQFTPPENPISEETKPILRGEWNNINGVHSILHWVNKNNPNGDIPVNPSLDDQYTNWEYQVAIWRGNNNIKIEQPEVEPTITTQPKITTPPTQIGFVITSPRQNSLVHSGQLLNITVASGKTLKKVEYYLDGVFIGSASKSPFSISVLVQNPGNHSIRAIGVDTTGSQNPTSVVFQVK